MRLVALIFVAGSALAQQPVAIVHARAYIDPLKAPVEDCTLVIDGAWCGRWGRIWRFQPGAG